MEEKGGTEDKQLESPSTALHSSQHLHLHPAAPALLDALRIVHIPARSRHTYSQTAPRSRTSPTLAHPRLPRVAQPPLPQQ